MIRFVVRIAPLLVLSLWLAGCAHYHGYGHGRPPPWAGYRAHHNHGLYHGYARPAPYGYGRPGYGHW